jgi:hypothetical protein
MSAIEQLIRYAVALNNNSVTLLHRGCCKEAIEAIKRAVEVVQQLVVSDNNTLENGMVTNGITVAHVATEYEMNCIYLDPSKSCHIAAPTSFTKHVNVIVVYDQEIVPTTMNMDDVMNRNNESSIFLIRLEYSCVDMIDLDFILSV